MSRTRRNGIDNRDGNRKAPRVQLASRYTGYYGEGIWNRKAKRWLKRLAAKANRRFLNATCEDY